jgi:pimeloyl-ACP methyl ester carboxylesterase
MLNFIVPLLLIYILLCLGLFLSQRSFIYFPVAARSEQYPSWLIEGDGATISISVKEASSSGAVIYFGGNAEDTSTTMLELCELLDDCAVFAMHYRGYGGSKGKPSEAMLHADAQALYDLVATKHSDVIVIGRSLGSGIAVRLASRNPVNRLILVTPFDSLANVAAGKLPFVPVRWLMWDRYESWKFAPGVEAPVLVLAAAQDEIIPLESTQRLVASFKEGQCQFEIIDPADHNSLELPRKTVQEFIDLSRGAGGDR